MPKVQFSDVTPPEKSSIRNIPIPGGRKRAPAPISPAEEPAQKEKEVFEYYPEEKPRKSGGRPWLFGSIAAVCIAAFIVGMMTVFASATVTITPKSEVIGVDTQITAVSDPQTQGVRYEVLKLSKSKTTPIPAAGEEAAEVKASGKIVIYNNFSADPQRLIVRTRFETPGGLIYRIPESVVIPGKTVKDGVETPGSIEVEVFADETGEKYNIKKTDFTIPGFKNDAARYTTIYARSSTDMTGGFVGTRKTVLPEDKQAAIASMTSEIEAEIKKDLESKVPAGLVLLPDAIDYESTELPAGENSSSVIIGQEVTAYALLLDATGLSQKITSEYLAESPEWNGITPVIKDFSGLSLKNTPQNFETGEEITLDISGTSTVWAEVDLDSVNQRLLGTPKKEAAKLINEFAGIRSVSAAIRPIWKQSFPDNPSKIYVYEDTSE